MSEDELFSKVKKILVEEFDIDENDVTPQASISDDLDLDSIDAVDLIVKVKPLLNGAVEPESFKSVKTVEDVVKILLPLTK